MRSPFKRGTITLVWMICVLSFHWSCSLRKPVLSPGGEISWSEGVLLERAKFEQLSSANELAYSAISARGKGSVQLANGTSHDVNVQLRIQKGEGVWVSFSGLMGLEVARMFVTSDSLKIINRLDKTYSLFHVDSLSSLVHPNGQVEFPVFAVVQQLLVGNVPSSLLLDEHVEFIEFAEGAGFRSQTYEGLVNPNYRLKHLKPLLGSNFQNQTSSLGVVHAYANSPAHGGDPAFPSSSSIQLPPLGKFLPVRTQLTLEYSRFERLESVALPFQIPKGYKSLH